MRTVSARSSSDASATAIYGSRGSYGLGLALQTLAKDRSFQLVYVSEEVDVLSTQGVVGEFTPEEALARLLAGN